MSFSSGDWIAIVVGSIAALRWLVEKVLNQTESDDERYARLELDYEKFKAARVEIDKATAESLRRLERGVGNLQSQLRLAVTGGGNKFFEIAPSDDKTGTND